MEGEEYEEVSNAEERDNVESESAEPTSDVLLQRALDSQSEVFRLTTNKDIKKAVTDKIKIEIQNLMQIIVLQSNEIHYLKGKLEEREKPRSYAEIAAREIPKTGGNRENRVVRNKKKRINNIVIVRPKKQQDNNNTLSEIKGSINPREKGIAIQGVRSTRNGGMVIKTETEEDLDKLIQEFQGKDEIRENYEVIKPKMRNPHIIIYDINSDITKEELENNLRENGDLFSENEEINIRHKIPTKNGNSWVLELKPETYTKLKGNKLRVGWQRVSFKEYLRPTLCYNCGRFGHIGKFCTNKKSCLRCGSESHTRQNCEVDKENCINCSIYNNKFRAKISTKHSCMDRKCRSWKREIENQIARTNYGE